MEQNDTITNSERSSTTMTPNSVISSAATEVFKFLKHSLVENDPVSSFVSGLVQEVICLRQKFAIAFPHNLTKVSTLLETIKNLRDELKQKDEEIMNLKDLKESEQKFCAQGDTFAPIQQELFHAQEELATFSGLCMDVRCRQLVMMAPLFSGEERKIAEGRTRDRTYRKAGDLGAHGAQIKSDLILTEKRPIFGSYVEAAYSISLPAMISLFKLSKEAHQLQNHHVKVHPGSFALIQACLEHLFHFKGLCTDPSEDLRDAIRAKLKNCGSVPLPLQTDHIRAVMSTESREVFDNHVGYNKRYGNFLSLTEDARKTYMEYAEKVHRAVQGRHSDLYGDATCGIMNELSAEQLNQEWWKDPEPLSLEAVNILRRFVLAIDCLFKPWANVSRGRVWPPTKSWESAKDFYGPALVSKKDDLTEAMVGKWE